MVILKKNMVVRYVTLLILCIFFAGCPSSGRYYADPNMDFGAIRTVAVMPFENLSSEKTAGDRVRDVFTNILLSTGQVYALPPGEVARAALRSGIATPTTPSTEEIIKLGAITSSSRISTGIMFKGSAILSRFSCPIPICIFILPGMSRNLNAN